MIRIVNLVRRNSAFALILFGFLACSSSQASEHSRHRGALSGKSIKLTPANKEVTQSLSFSKSIDPVLRDAMKNAPKANQWPDESYAQLLDLDDITIHQNGDVTSVYRSAYKLFNDRSHDMGDVSLNYDASHERLEILQARTIQKNGEVLVIHPKDVRISSQYGDYPLYQEYKNIDFSLPGIEDDCIIDYTYRRITKPNTVSGYFWHGFGFPIFFPAYLSRLTVSLQ